MEYKDFIQNKKHSSNNYGIELTENIKGLFDFQEYVLNYENSQKQIR